MKNSTQTGIVKRHPDGFGFLIPDDTEHPDLYLSKKEMRGVMTNDRVEAEVQKEKNGNRFYGVDVKVLERGVAKVVGKVQRQGDGDLLVYGGYEKWGAPLSIPYRNARGATEGDLVAIEIVEYPDKGKSKEFVGKVIEIIGDEADPMNDIKRVLHLQNIPTEFSLATQHEVQCVPSEVAEKDVKGRVDLRKKCFMTIDGVTAKDFDDAIYVEQKAGKGFTLWVAIADVSHYVRIGSEIDRQANERGTSVYLPNFVVPMLPEVLSNGICSLMPKVDRLAFVCEMQINFDGVVSDAKVYEAVIRSHARVTYGEAQDVLNGDAEHEDPQVGEKIELAANLAKILMAKRFREGSLELEVPETEVIVDELGNPVDIIKSERVFAHKLIEEMMLVANISVARLIQDKEQPNLNRIHEPPKQEDIEKLQKFLHNFGSEKKLRGGHLQKKLSQSLQEFQGKPEGTVLNILTLRSMSQAKYSPDNVGHFGLGFDDYCHFTSPIRRYPDLITHRVAKALYCQTPVGYLYSDEDLVTAGNMLSACEQRAVKAERMVVSIKKARFMQDKVGETYEGVISSVAKFGVFVLLRQFDVDGLVKVESLGQDYFEFDEENLFLSGKRTKKIYRIGDTVEILVAAANTEDGKIDFVLAEGGEVDHGAKPKFKSKKSRSKSKRKPQSKFQSKSKSKSKEKKKDKESSGSKKSRKSSSRSGAKKRRK